jgi:hypothetical protein
MPPDSIVICFRVSDARAIHLVEGVLREKCTGCKEDVFISPETTKRKEETQASIYCFNCALELVTKSSHVTIAPPSEGQIEEIKKDIEFHKNKFKLN